MGRNTYKRGQLASFTRLAYPCNQANENKKKEEDITIRKLYKFNYLLTYAVLVHEN